MAAIQPGTFSRLIVGSRWRAITETHHGYVYRVRKLGRRKVVVEGVSPRHAVEQGWLALPYADFLRKHAPI